MGWGRTLLLGDEGDERPDLEDSERDIEQMRRNLKDKQRKDRAQDDAISELQAENDELKLYLASLIRLLVSKGAFDAAEFKRFVDLIDAEDGASDGRFTGDVV